MTEYVFRPLRRGVRSRLYSGRYTIVRGEKPRTVPLGTPDLIVARKKLRDIIINAQREAEGIVAPAAQREAAAAPLAELLADYQADWAAMGRTQKHIDDSTHRIERILKETGWTRLRDIRADQFVKWRATLTCAAKTAREYHAAFSAFLNWLVRMDRLAVNPIGKVPKIETRGKQVRAARAFTVEELTTLFTMSPTRRLVYQVLTYTGQRREEVKTLRWSDVHLDEERPYVLFRAEEMKDAEKRPMPLHPRLAAELRAYRPAGVAADALVFPTFPKHRTLIHDLERCGIARRSETGRVVHFHSFRKTFQTLGVKHGINQRAAQELLGHSDANITAKIYTDVPALGLHAEVAKLPWVGGKEAENVVAAERTLSPLETAPENTLETALGGILAELVKLAKTASTNDLKRLETLHKWGGQRDSNPGGPTGEADGAEKEAEAGRLVVAALRSLLGGNGQ